MPGILGKKIGMTRLINDDGRVIPLTVVECQPNTVVQVKTEEKDGYPALVLGFDALKKPTKNRKFRHLREFRVTEEDEPLKSGSNVTVEIFEQGETAKITSVSKGKGFQGVIKRHNFSRGPETHGSHHHREPGSIGACARPARVHKGKKMPGRMGGDTKTREEVEIVYVDKEKNLLGVKGPVAGAKGSLIIIRK
jgi:large subunit ribosomal protein L3